MEKNKKNRIISFIVTFFYSLMAWSGRGVCDGLWQ